MFKRYISLLLLGIGVLFGGCASTSSMPSSGDFVLSEINGQAASAGDVTLSIRDGNIIGRGPINNWRASITDGVVGPMISTRMAGPPEAMQLESKLLSVLEGASLSREGGELVFTKGSDTVTFAPQSK